MAEQYDFAGLFSDPEFQSLDPQIQQETVRQAWGEATKLDPALGEMSDSEREYFLTTVYNRSAPLQPAVQEPGELQPSNPWEAYQQKVEGMKIGPGLPFGNLYNKFLGSLGSDTWRGVSSRGINDAIVAMLSGDVSLAGNIATEAVSAPTEVSWAGFHAPEAVDALTAIAQQEGIENPTDQDLMNIAMTLEGRAGAGEMVDENSILGALTPIYGGEDRADTSMADQVRMLRAQQAREAPIAEALIPISEAIRSYGAGTSPLEEEHPTAAGLLRGGSTTATIMLPVIAAAMSGNAPALGALIGTAAPIAAEDASRAIEEEYGEYRPEVVLPSTAVQTALEMAGGPEARLLEGAGKKLFQRLTSKGVIKAVAQNFVEEMITESLQSVAASSAKHWSEGEKELWFSLTDEEKAQALLEGKMAGPIGGLFGGAPVVLKQVAARLGEIPEERLVKQLLAVQEGTVESMPEKAAPDFERAMQVRTETAPEVLFQEGREEALGRYARQELSDEELGQIIAETGGAAETATKVREEAEARALEELGVSSFEEIGEERIVPGSHDPNTVAGRTRQMVVDYLIRQGQQEAADNFELTIPKTNEERNLHRAAAQRGVELMFSDEPLAQAGMSAEPGVVVVDRNASVQQQVKAVLAHEMSHQLRLSQPQTWMNLARLMQTKFQDAWVAARQRVAQDPGYADLTQDERLEEIVAQVVEAQGEKVWMAIGKEAEIARTLHRPGLFQRVIDWFVDAAGAIGRAAGLNIPSLQQLKDQWELPLEIAKALNVNLGAPRSIITEAVPQQAASPAEVSQTPGTSPSAGVGTQVPPITETPAEIPPAEAQEAAPEAAEEEAAPAVAEEEAPAEGRVEPQETNQVLNITRASNLAVGDVVMDETGQQRTVQSIETQGVRRTITFTNGDTMSVGHTKQFVQVTQQPVPVHKVSEEAVGKQPAKEVAQPAAKEEAKAAATRKEKPKRQKKQRGKGRRSRKERMKHATRKLDADAVRQARAETEDWAADQTFASPAARATAMKDFARSLYNDIVTRRESGRQVEGWAKRATIHDQALYQRAMDEVESVFEDELKGLPFGKRQELMHSLAEIRYRRKGGVRFATRMPGFYSPTYRKVATIQQQKMLPSSLMKILQKEAGSPQELKLIDLEGFLETAPKDEKGNVDLDDVLTFLENNGVIIEEIVLREENREEYGEPQLSFDQWREQRGEEELREEYLRDDGPEVTQFKPEIRNHTREEIFMGGFGWDGSPLNYPEFRDDLETIVTWDAPVDAEGTAITLREKVFPPGTDPFVIWEFAAEKVREQLSGPLYEKWVTNRYQHADAWADAAWTEDEEEVGKRRTSSETPFGPEDWPSYNTKNGRKYRELLFIIPGSSYDKAHHYRDGGHLGVAMHLRFTEHLDSQGRKTLFVEEIQSDWYTDIRKQRDMIAHRQLEKELYDKYGARFSEAVNFSERWDDDRLVMDKPLRELLTEEEYRTWTDSRAKTRHIPESIFEVEDVAPMVSGKPEQWIGMAAKRLLLWAAEHNYGQIAWLTGEQQIERSKHAGMEVVDEIRWETVDGQKVITTFKGGEPTQYPTYTFDNRGQTVEENEHFENIWEVFGQNGDTIMTEKSGKLEGDLARVGGGMFRMIYDSRFPKALAKAAKEVGIGQVEMGTEKYNTANFDIDEDDPDVNQLGPAIEEDEARKLYLEGKPVYILTIELNPRLGRIEHAELMEPAEEGGLFDNWIPDPGDPTVSGYSFHSPPTEGPPVEHPTMVISEELRQAIRTNEFRAMYATRPLLTDEEGGAISRQDQAIALSPGEAWAGELTRVIDKVLERLPGDKSAADYRAIIQDHFLRLKHLNDALARQGIFLPEAYNVYLAEEMMYGTTDYEVRRARARVVAPILAYMHEHHINKEQAHEFLRALHAMERNRQGYRINFTEALAAARKRLDGAKEGGLRAAQAQAQIDQLEAAKNSGMIRGSGTTDRAAFEILKRLVDSGELRLNLDEFARTYGYKDAADVLSATRARQYETMDGWTRKFYQGTFGGKFAGLQKVFQRLTDEKLALQLKYELVDPETHGAIKNMYQYYAPLRGAKEFDQGDVEDMIKMQGLPRGVNQFLDIRSVEDKRALGRLSHPTHNILAQAFQDLERSIVRGEKNKVGRTFLELAEQYLPESLVEINKVVARRVFDKNTGSVQEVNDFWYNERSNVLATKRGGEVYFITIKDGRLATAMKALGEKNQGTFAKLHGKAMRTLASLATSLNPEFWLSNAARDIQTAVFNAIGERQPIPDWAVAKMITQIPAAAISIHASERAEGLGREPKLEKEWAQLWERMQKAGGRIGYFGLTNVDRTFQRADRELHYIGREGITVGIVKSAQAFFGAIENVNTAFENATRLVAFKAALDAGLTDKQAGSLARNLTVNFNRHGSGRALSSWYMFANANIQGVARMLQALGNRRVRRLMAELTAMSYMLASWNRAVMGKDDDGNDKWDNLSQYHKNKRLLIAFPLPGERTFLLGIPAPHGYSVFHALGTGFESIAHAAGNKDLDVTDAVGQVGANVMSSLADSFNPLGGRFDTIKGFTSNFVPTIPRILFDAFSNKDYAGRSIRPEYYQKGTPWYQTHTRGASPWAVWSSKAMNTMTGGDTVKPGFVNMSPDTIDFLLTSASSGLGKFISDSAQAIVVGARDRELPQLYKTPFIRRFAYEYTPSSSHDDYYELRDRMWKVRRDYSEAKENHDAELAKELREEYGVFLNEGLYKRLQMAEKKRKAAKESGDRAAESKAMLEWLKAYKRYAQAL